jgi:hypothetical protein
VADPIALAREKKDQFYLTAFMLQAWLGALVVQAAAEFLPNPLIIYFLIKSRFH